MSYPETLPDGASAGETGHVTDHNLIATAVGNIDARLHTVEIASPTGMTQEQIQDMMSTFLVAGTNVTLSYNDTGNTLTISASGGGGGLTQEQVEDIVSTLIVAGTNITKTYDDTNGILTLSATGGGSGPYQGSLNVTISGVVAQQTGALRFYNDSGDTRTITSVRATCTTAPSGTTGTPVTGAALVVDVNKNGTTLFTTQSNRPAIPSGQATNKATTIQDNQWYDNTYLTFDVDFVGSTIPGSDLNITLEWTT